MKKQLNYIDTEINSGDGIMVKKEDIVDILQNHMVYTIKR